MRQAARSRHDRSGTRPSASSIRRPRCRAPSPSGSNRACCWRTSCSTPPGRARPSTRWSRSCSTRGCGLSPVAADGPPDDPRRPAGRRPPRRHRAAATAAGLTRAYDRAGGGTLPRREDGARRPRAGSRSAAIIPRPWSCRMRWRAGALTRHGPAGRGGPRLQAAAAAAAGDDRRAPGRSGRWRASTTRGSSTSPRRTPISICGRYSRGPARVRAAARRSPSGWRRSWPRRPMPELVADRRHRPSRCRMVRRWHWQAPGGPAVRAMGIEGVAPSLDAGRICSSTSTRLQLLDPADGSPRWSAELGGPRSGPATSPTS